MKRTLYIIISASAASVLASSALAQDTLNTKPDRPDYTREGKPHVGQTHQLNGAAKASDVIGMTVNNYQNEKLGTVEDLAVDMESGRIVQVILSTGGILGIGDTMTAVPPGALHHDVTLKVLHLDANQEKLKSAPKFEMSKWAEFSDANHLSTVYRHYGQEPAFTIIHKGDAVLDGQVNKEGQTQRDNQPNNVATRKADGTWDKDRLFSENQSMIPASRLGKVQKASHLGVTRSETTLRLS